MQVGEVIAGRYRVDRVVRRGGLSVLVAARDQKSGHRVALKVVALDPNDDGIRLRLEREVEILQRLSHPRIVRFFDAGILSPIQVYLALEWLDGFDLSERMSNGPVTLRTALEVVAQVAEALDLTHRQGVIHRDIKPANIFVMGTDGPVDCRVLDFGVAKVASTSSRLTHTGAILGTPNYMAPEQAGSAMTVDGRADLYSLGVVAFELVTRRLPFSASTDLARLARILVEDAVPIRRVVPDLPVAATELIDGMLVREPGGRIGSAEAVRVLAEGTLSALSADALDRVYTPADVPEPESQFEGTVPLVPVVRSAVDNGGEVDPTPVDLGEPFALRREGGRAVVDDRPLESANTYPTAVASVVDPSAAWLSLGVESADERSSGAQRCHSDFVTTAPLYGRDAQVERMLQRVSDAIESALPTLQLYVGPGGIGKTRLRAELVNRLAREAIPPWVFAARAEESRSRVPFGFIRQLLFAVARVAADDAPRVRAVKVLRLVPSPYDVQRLLADSRPLLGSPDGDVEAAELERAMVAAFVAEALGLSYPEVPPVLAARSDPARAGLLMVQALDVVLRGQASDGGLVVIIDDIQWLDHGSARVLRTLLGGQRSVSVAVVGFGSPTLLDPDAHGEWPLSDLGASVETVTRIGRLTPSASRKLAAGLLDAPAFERDIERVIQKATGNVLYLEQLVLALVDTGQWHLDGGRMRWSPDPEPLYPTVAAAVSARLTCLSSTALRVLTAAAVFGPVFWAEGVAELTRMTTAEVAAELQRLVDARWVRPRRPSRYLGQTELEFCHGALHAVALSRLKRKRRVAFESRAASYLVMVGEREPSVLATHRAAAEERSAQTYLAAAERALRLGDPATAARLAEDGRGHTSSTGEPMSIALLSVTERVALATEDWALGTETLEILEAHVASPAARADIACRQCRLALRTDRLAEARAASERALQVADETGLSGPWVAQVHLHRAEVAERFGERRLARQLYTSAHRTLEGQPDWKDALARATAGLARAALMTADYASAESRYRSALADARTRHHADQTIEALWGLVDACRQMGDLRRARAFAGELERNDFGPGRLVRARLLRGYLAAEGARWSEAQTLLEHALAQSQPGEPLEHRALVAQVQLLRLPHESTPGLDRDRDRLVQLQTQAGRRFRNGRSHSAGVGGGLGSRSGDGCATVAASRARCGGGGRASVRGGRRAGQRGARELRFWPGAPVVIERRLPRERACPPSAGRGPDRRRASSVGRRRAQAILGPPEHRGDHRPGPCRPGHLRPRSDNPPPAAMRWAGQHSRVLTVTRLRLPHRTGSLPQSVPPGTGRRGARGS